MAHKPTFRICTLKTPPPNTHTEIWDYVTQVKLSLPVIAITNSNQREKSDKNVLVCVCSSLSLSPSLPSLAKALENATGTTY